MVTGPGLPRGVPRPLLARGVMSQAGSGTPGDSAEGCKLEAEWEHSSLEGDKDLLACRC